MECIVKKFVNKRIVCLLTTNTRYVHVNGEPYYKKNNKNLMDKDKGPHPYGKIHNWRSKQIFIDHMLKHVIYNKDGLVGINKPYGISARQLLEENPNRNKSPSGIVHEVNYTLMDVLPALAKSLNYESLSIIRTPEKFTSGVTLLGNNEQIESGVVKSLRIAEASRIIPRTYWTVTRRVPGHPKGEKRLAMRLKKPDHFKRPVPVLVEKWGSNERERGDIKILNVQYKIIANSTMNLASLVEIKSSTTQWHAIRLFAASNLLCPILGDRIYGSRSQVVLDKLIEVNPLIEAAHVPPKIEKDLLRLIKIQSYRDTIIPAHVHLKEIYLPSFLKKGNDVTIRAPLFPYFSYTLNRLKIDFDSFINNHEDNEDVINNENVENNEEIVNKIIQ